MRFIPVQKINKLREAARSGDDNARKILEMQLDGKDDFSELLNQYFTPKVEPEQEPETEVEILDAGLQTFLKDNEIDKDNPEYQSYVDDYYKENPRQNANQLQERECEEMIKKLMKEELDAIESYSKAITQTMASEELSENQKRKIISRFTEIRDDENEHYTELKQLLNICKAKDEEETEN